MIPFSLNPKNWGLKGVEREIALAHHQLVGEDLDRRLLELKYPTPRSSLDMNSYRLAKLDIEHTYGHIDSFQYDMSRIEIENPNKKSTDYKRAVLDCRYQYDDIEDREYDMKVLELQHKDHNSQAFLLDKAALDLKHGDLTEQKYRKECATIRGEPYVEMIKADLKYAEGNNNFEFELDWNEAFIEDLMRHGWRGLSQEEIIDEWFTQTCQDIFNLDPEFQIDEQLNPSTITRAERDGDKTEFS